MLFLEALHDLVVLERDRVARLEVLRLLDAQPAVILLNQAFLLVFRLVAKHPLIGVA